MTDSTAADEARRAHLAEQARLDLEAKRQREETLRLERERNAEAARQGAEAQRQRDQNG